MEPNTDFWEITGQENNCSSDGKEFNGYFSRRVTIRSENRDPSPIEEKMGYWILDICELPSEEKEGENDVYRNAEFPHSPIASANTDSVTDFLKWRNLVEIKDAGKNLDKVKHALDNGKYMDREECGVLLRDAYERLESVYERVENFEHNEMELVYTEEDKKEFLEYVERLAGHAVALGWRAEKLGRELEPENNTNHSDVYQHLEPSETIETGGVDMKDMETGKTAAAD